MKRKTQRTRGTVGRVLWLLAVVVAVAVLTQAQTVRPILSEFQVNGKGRVELVNDSAQPLNVIVVPKGFQVSETGEISYGELPENVHIKLSAMSFRIPAKQSYYVFYEAKADALPAWFVLYFNFVGLPPKDHSGLNVQIELPHTVYLLPKRPFKKTDAAVSATYEAAKKTVVITVENHGATVGRTILVEAQKGSIKSQGYGFPIYPQKRRIAEIPWTASAPPEKVTLVFNDFKIDAPVR